MDNEDDSYKTFLKYLDKNLILEVNAMRCFKVWTPVAAGSRLKKHVYDYELL